MSESSQNTPATRSPAELITLLLAEYEFARENRNQSDATAWEMTAIVWGGQILLLGFVLEAISNRAAQSLVMLAGFLSLLMCPFNYVVMRARRKVCNLMNDICVEIENNLPLPTKPQNRLTAVYRRGTQSWWFDIVNWSFFPVWLAVIVTAGCLYFSHCSR